MMRTLMICLIAAVSAAAQGQTKDAPRQTPATATPTATPSQPATPPSLLKRDEAAIPPGQTVLTVRGVCPAQTEPAAKATVPASNDCVTTITKEQFDNLVNAFNTTNQPVPPAQRRKLAEAYVELLIFSEAAQSAGVEKSPAFAEVMRVLRMKTLSDLYRNQLIDQFRNPSQPEIEAYYKENESKYESAKLSRIYLPKNDPVPQATAEQKQEYQNKAQHMIDDLQARAAKGEAIANLQKEAYLALGIKAVPPTTDLSTARHGMFPPKLEQEIFSHKAGEVFRSDDGSGYVLYRVESRQTGPLDSVKDEIARELSRRKLENKIKELTTPVHSEFDDIYFGPPAPAAPAGQPGHPLPNPSR